MAVDLEWERACKLAPSELTYERLGKDIGRLLETKQAQYGDSFGVAPLLVRFLYPDGVGVEHYDNLLAVVRILDKLKRIATAKADDPEDAWSDIAGYAILMLAQRRKADGETD